MFTQSLLTCTSATILAALWAPSAWAEPISLDEALRRAQDHPLLAAEDADIDAVRGQERTARTYVYNPELGVAAGPRLADEREVDLEVSLSQTFELGGKRRARIEVATADLRRARAERARLLQAVLWSVRASYARALVARNRVRATRESETVAAALASLARERMAAGSGTRISLNQAVAEIGRATSERLRAEQAYEEAAFELSAAVGVPQNVKLEPEGELALRADPVDDVETAVARALSSRADLIAARERTTQARANVRLQRSLAVPDVTAGVVFSREERAEIGLVALSIPLPLWNRNQGARVAAAATVRRTRALEELAGADVARQTRIAYDRWRKTRGAVDAFDLQALGTLRDNLDLTREAFEAGKLSIVEYSLLRRSFVEVELDLLDAVAAEVDAYYALRLALGDDGSRP